MNPQECVWEIRYRIILKITSQEKVKIQDYQDAQDKQQTQHPLTPRSEWKMHQRFSRIQSECPDIWIHLPKHKWPKSWSSMEDPFVPLERNLYGQPFAGLWQFWRCPGFTPPENLTIFGFLKMSGFTPPKILAIFGPPLWSPFSSSEMSWTRQHLKNTQTPNT